MRSKPLTIGNAKKISGLKLWAYVSRIEKGGNKSHLECVKRCLDDSKNWASNKKKNKLRYGPYRIYVS